MYNNEITYDPKWDTEENRRLANLVMKFIYQRALCMSDVPLSWAKEVNELITAIHKRYRIAYELSSWNGYYINVSLSKIIRATGLYFAIFKRQIIGTLYNKLFKPQVRLSQVKEKYGQLRVYFDVIGPNDIENDIDILIRQTEIKLAKKGAYYSIGNIIQWSRTTYENDEPVTTYPYKDLLEQE